MKAKVAFGIGILVFVAVCFSAASLYVSTRVVLNLMIASSRRAHTTTPDDLDLARIHEAERDVRNGKGKEALVALAPLEVLNSNRGCMITLIRGAACCMTEGNCQRIQAESDAGQFTGMLFGCDELYQKLLLYCSHAARNGSPSAAANLIELAKYLDSWISPRCDLQLLQAEYYLKGGDKREAAVLCQRLWDDGEENSWNWSDVDDDQRFKLKLASLKEKAGASDEKWLMAREIRDFPTNSSFYLQPLGDVDANVIEEVRANVQSFFGAPAKVLTAMPLTHRERSFMVQEGRYDADHLRPDMIGKLRVPADAFSVVLITGEKMGTEHIGWIYSQSSENRHLISSFMWRDWHRHWQVVTLSRAVVSAISNQLNLRGTFPCVTTGSGDYDAIRRAKFAYSPEIQEKYRAVDLLAAKSKSIEDYKAWGATIVDP